MDVNASPGTTAAAVAMTSMFAFPSGGNESVTGRVRRPATPFSPDQSHMRNAGDMALVTTAPTLRLPTASSLVLPCEPALTFRNSVAGFPLPRKQGGGSRACVRSSFQKLHEVNESLFFGHAHS